MKIQTNPRRQPSAFTLIELLVVIAIIAILATIAVPVGGKVMERAKILQAKTAMKGLEIAINGYRTEYNRMPLASTASGDDPVEYDTGTAQGLTLLKTLMAQDNTNNPRQIKFYEPQTAKSGANGLVDGEGGGLFDPWAKPYTIVIDYSGTGLIDNPYAGENGEPEQVSSSVIIYSGGPDEQLMGGGEEGGKNDDVKSWN